MDIVSIEQLKVTATIGVYDWERQIKQTLFFDLQWAIDAAKVAEQELSYQPAIKNIFQGLEEKVFNYVEVSDKLQCFVEENAFYLIETLAEKTAQFLLSSFKFKWLKLKLIKPGVINNAKGVSITIERHFNDIHNRECNGNENSK